MNEGGTSPIILNKEDTTIQTGEKIFDEISQYIQKNTAIFAVNDAMAIGLLNRIRKKGLKVLIFTVNDPDELAYVTEIEVDGVFTNNKHRLLGKG